MLGLVTLPLRLGVGAARLTLRSAAVVLRHFTEDREQEDLAPRPATHPEQWAPPRSPPRSRPPAPEAPAPEPPAPEPPAEDEPLVAEEHVSEEPQLVAESADPDATEPPGPEISVEEPWPGYRRARAGEVIATLPDISREELVVAQLYEASHRRRRTVLEAIERQLKIKSPPRT